MVFPELEQYLHAPYTTRDWDSYGAKPVIPFAVQVCDLFMRCVTDRFGHYLAPYWTGADPAGGMMLHYESSNAQFELEIFIDEAGSLGWLLVDAFIEVLDRANHVSRYPFEVDQGASWWEAVAWARMVAGDTLRRSDPPRLKYLDTEERTLVASAGEEHEP